MVHITTQSLKASERGEVHTFLLVRVLSDNATNCRVSALDLGRDTPNVSNIIGCLCDNDCEDILDNIVKDKEFYINNSKMIVSLNNTEATLYRRNVTYKITMQ